MPKILITGGTGFAGSHLIEILISKGYRDLYSTTFNPPEPAFTFLSADRYREVDLSDSMQAESLIKEIQPEWIFHLASFAYVGKSFEHARELFANNINLQLNLLEAIRLHAPRARLLTIGSAEEYGVIPKELEAIDENCPLNPVNPYAVSKVTQDMLAGSYVLSYGLDIVRARPFNHIGIRQSGDFAIPTFARQIVDIEQGKQQTLKVGNLDAIRDFTSVKDVVNAYILLMEKGLTGEVYNIGSGVGYTMKEIVEKLCSFAQVPITIETDPTRMRPHDVPKLIANVEKIQSLGWESKENIDVVLQEILISLRT